MRVGGIGTRYAAWIAALALALVATALAAAGVIAFRESRLVQDEMHDAVGTARAADEEAALRGTARYLGAHLFNALYQLDVERLNENDRAGPGLAADRVVPRGRRGAARPHRRHARQRAVRRHRRRGLCPARARRPRIVRRGAGTEIRFVISVGRRPGRAGASSTLAEAPWQASLAPPRGEDARPLWTNRRASLLSLGVAAFAVTLGLGLLTAVLLSRSLARPLTEMSRAAEEIAAGNLDHPLTLDSPDELGDLARALNRMAGDLRAHEEALRAERADLAAKNAELERFTYTVSHDLKSPLVTIRGFAGLAGTDLATGKLDRVRQDLGRIVAASDKMQRLLEDLLELSRVGRVVNPAEDGGPRAARAGGGRAASRARSTRGASWWRSPPASPWSRRTEGASSRSTRTSWRTPPSSRRGSPAPRIEIGARSDRGEPVFYVKDNGRGIEPRFLERVFDLFEKLDPGASGTGVGLALVRRIVEAHGGRAWAESDGPGRGATFCFTLPSA